METEDLLMRRLLASGSGVFYWLGVIIQARRVRRHIGRSPNLNPRGTKEKLLWFGWMLVVLSWIAGPFLCGPDTQVAAAKPVISLILPAGLVMGTLLLIAGYAGTQWCYRVMGDAWRIGVNRKEKTFLVTNGPYRLVRHPIYSFQLVMISGICLLLPAPVFTAVLVLHLVCVNLKAQDEESYLAGVHGDSYTEYVKTTGRLVPRFAREKV